MIGQIFKTQIKQLNKHYWYSILIEKNTITDETEKVLFLFDIKE